MNISKRTLRNVFLGVAASILLYWLLFDTDRVRSVWHFLKNMLSPFVIGAGLAFVINVPMRAVETLLKGIKNRGLRRVIAVLLTLSMVVLVLVLVVRLLIPQLVSTVNTLISRLPGFFYGCVDVANKFLEENPEVLEWILENAGIEQINWGGLVEKLVAFVGDSVSTIVMGAVAAIGSLTTGIFNGVISLVFALYCLSRKEILAGQGRRIIYAFLPEKAGDEIIRVSRLTGTTFGNFISGQCLEACILGAMFAVTMPFFKMPYVPLVSVLVAITALVPIVGAFVGCAFGAFFILVDDPVKALWFIVLFLVLQQIEGNAIYPKVVGSSVGLPGMWVLLAVAVGGEIMGVAGMFVMIPAFSVVYTLLGEITSKRLGEKNIASEKLLPQPPDRKIRPERAKKAKKAKPVEENKAEDTQQ